MSANGSKADISAKFYVRFTPESGLLQRTGRCPLWAKSGHHLIRPTPPRASGELAGSLGRAPWRGQILQTFLLPSRRCESLKHTQCVLLHRTPKCSRGMLTCVSIEKSHVSIHSKEICDETPCISRHYDRDADCADPSSGPTVRRPCELRQVPAEC